MLPAKMFGTEKSSNRLSQLSRERSGRLLKKLTARGLENARRLERSPTRLRRLLLIIPTHLPKGDILLPVFCVKVCAVEERNVRNQMNRKITRWKMRVMEKVSPLLKLLDVASRVQTQMPAVQVQQSWY